MSFQRMCFGGEGTKHRNPQISKVLDFDDRSEKSRGGRSVGRRRALPSVPAIPVFLALSTHRATLALDPGPYG